MRIVFDDNLKSEKIFAENEEVENILGGDVKRDGKCVFAAEIKNPVLVTDLYRISKLDIITRDLLFQLFSAFPRIVEYDGVETFWDPSVYNNVWCPSIDTLVFAGALNNILKSRNFKSAVDIGCGSGFLGKYALIKQARKKKPFQKLHFIDINPYAIKCAIDNLKGQSGRTMVSYSLSLKNAPLLISDKYDLIICNPPYVPRPKTVDINPYEGLFLIKELCRIGKDCLNENGLILINISSLSEKMVLPDLKRAFKIEKIIEKFVPLKVLPIICGKTRKSRMWLEYLGKNGLVKNKKSGYFYWHKIKVLACRPK